MKRFILELDAENLAGEDFMRVRAISRILAGEVARALHKGVVSSLIEDPMTGKIIGSFKLED